MSNAREIKTVDEISLLTHSAAMVDAAYYELYTAMKPGMRENDAVALVAQKLYEMGSETSRASTPSRPSAPARTRTCSRTA